MSLRIERVSRIDPNLVKILFNNSGMNGDVFNSKFFMKEENIMLVAYQNELPAGFLYAYLIERPNAVSPIMFLYSIDVFPNFQKQGIGSALVEQLKELSITCNCSEVFVLTNDSNIAAKSLYEKTGGESENSDDVMYVYALTKKDH